MAFQKKRVNWKRVRPSNLRDAFRLCKEHARIKNNLSVERLAELMGVTADVLYKWLSNGKMPATLIQVYEHICGISFVSDYLASTSGKMVIDIPTGKTPSPMEINALQACLAESMHILIKFHTGNADRVQTEECLLHSIKGLAHHYENVRKYEQPELELEQ